MAASTPPVVKWMRWDADLNKFVVPNPYLWDAGIVEAGSTSEGVDGNNLFYVWNNNADLTDYEAGGCADMINVRISVKDENGTDTDKKVCGDSTDPNKQASVSVQIFNDSKGASGEWGSYDQTGQWTTEKWQDLTSSTPVPVTQASGVSTVTQTGGKVSGAAGHSGISGADRGNFIQLKLRISAKGTADAGTVRWINRISYQYQ